MTKAELKALKKLRKRANFETAGFGNCAEALPIQVRDVTEFIKERTRVYRDSWVLPIIDALIAKYDHKLNGVGEKPKGYNPITETYKW